MERGTPIRTLLVLMLLCVASVAGADMMSNLAKTTPKERAEIQTAFLKKKLGLSDDETTKVAAINLKYAEKAEPVIKGSDGPFMKMRQMREIQGEKDGAMKATLTPAQYQAYEASKEELKEKFEDAVAKKIAGGTQ